MTLARAPFLRLVLALLLSAQAVGHAQGLLPAVDPANLAGERVPLHGSDDDVPANHGAAALAQSLRKLRTRASLMLIVAHPDDEDGGMLTYESRGQGARVAMLTLTRGEGGQNLMSADFNDALGLIRTRELLAADRYMGVDQFFGSVVDFGFSKTKEEAFAQWGHDRVLYDAVRAVRLYRPLVIAAVFVGGVTDGHGQHQVSGEIAQEVFNAAGDPKVFPEMLQEGLQPWTPLKVYARVPFARIDSRGMFDYATGQYSPAHFHNYVTREDSPEPFQPNVTIPEGEVSEVLGQSYIQQARMGLSLQKSQNGGGRSAPSGRFDVQYHRYGSRVSSSEQESSFFDGIDVSLRGIASLAPAAGPGLAHSLASLDATLDQAAQHLDPKHPEATAPGLRSALAATDKLIASVDAESLPVQQRFDLLHELRIKRVQLNEALVQALGLSLSARAASGIHAAVPGHPLDIQVTLAESSPTELTTRPILLLSSGSETRQTAANHPSPVNAGHPLSTSFHVAVPADATPTVIPYTRSTDEQAFYTFADPRLRNAPLPRPAFIARATVDFLGTPIELETPVELAEDHGATLSVVPALSVALSPASRVIPLSKTSFAVTAHLESSVAASQPGILRLELPAGWHSTPAEQRFQPSVGRPADLSFVVTPAHLVSGQPYRIAAVTSVGERSYRTGYRAVGYPGIPVTNMYAPAVSVTRAVDVRVAPGLRVGYLAGTGDDVPAFLRSLDLNVRTLKVSDLTPANLAELDTVILGVRAYSAHPDLASASDALLEFARAGGTVIVQYLSGQFPERSTPFPLNLGDAERVVDEHAAVHILAPHDPALTSPNVITERDFDGWVEERGHGFLQSWDPTFTALLETHDPGQKEQRGGLVVAAVGRGHYVYCALALYRQLPEAVPGAARLFANLISLGKADTRQAKQP